MGHAICPLSKNAYIQDKFTFTHNYILEDSKVRMLMVREARVRVRVRVRVRANK